MPNNDARKSNQNGYKVTLKVLKFNLFGVKTNANCTCNILLKTPENNLHFLDKRLKIGEEMRLQISF